MEAIQMHSSKKEKIISQIFGKFLKSQSNFIVFKKIMTLISYVFPQLRTAKDVVR